jgi:hypothetical protein
VGFLLVIPLTCLFIPHDFSAGEAIIPVGGSLGLLTVCLMYQAAKSPVGKSVLAAAWKIVWMTSLVAVLAVVVLLIVCAIGILVLEAYLPDGPIISL